MPLQILTVCLMAFLAVTAYPDDAHAYLVPLIGLIGAIGSMAGVVVTAVIGALYITYRVLRGKKSDDAAEENSGSTEDKK